MMLKNIVRSKDAHPDMLFPRRGGLIDITNMTDQEIVDMVNWRIEHSSAEDYKPINDLVEKYCK